MQEMWVQSLDQKGPLEKEMTIHSSILAWEILWTEEPGRLQSMRSQESDMTYRLNQHKCIILSVHFLLLLHQFHFRPSGIRSWRVGTPS